LEIGTLWPATSTDDTVLVQRDFCAVESTIASDLSGFIASVTDGQTDGQTDRFTIANTALCIAGYADAL